MKPRKIDFQNRYRSRHQEVSPSKKLVGNVGSAMIIDGGCAQCKTDAVEVDDTCACRFDYGWLG